MTVFRVFRSVLVSFHKYASDIINSVGLAYGVLYAVFRIMTVSESAISLFW